MSNPKFKVGDKIKILRSAIPKLVGKIATIANIDHGSVVPIYILDNFVDVVGSFNGYRMREELLELYQENIAYPTPRTVKLVNRTWNLAAGKPNFCVGCNTFNEYQDQAYVCFRCENGI